jgi:hypothetical protein
MEHLYTVVMGIKNGRAGMENSVEVPHKVAKGIIM